MPLHNNPTYQREELLKMLRDLGFDFLSDKPELRLGWEETGWKE